MEPLEEYLGHAVQNFQNRSNGGIFYFASKEELFTLKEVDFHTK
jgi:hypothetical protein